MYQYKINTDCKLSKIQLDDNEHVAYIVDDFLEIPEEMIHLGKYNSFYMPVGSEGSWYPGVRDTSPKRYDNNIKDYLEKMISSEYFSGSAIRCSDYRSFLSLTTLKPEELSVQQYCPHTDSSSDMAFAAVLYLCDESHGGTSVYRYKPKNLVRVGPEHVGVIPEIIDAVKNRPEDHNGYLNGDTSLFERVGQIPMKFNRLVIFKQNLLHSPDIDPDVSCIKDAQKGRFTVVTHMNFELI